MKVSAVPSRSAKTNRYLLNLQLAVGARIPAAPVLGQLKWQSGEITHEYPQN